MIHQLSETATILFAHLKRKLSVTNQDWDPILRQNDSNNKAKWQN